MKIPYQPNMPIPGIKVVGFRGRVDPRYTPATRGPVFTTDDDLLVIGEPRLVEGEQAVTIMVSNQRLAPEDPLPDLTTRVPPSPAFYGYNFAFVGRAEIHALSRILDAANENAMSVYLFLDWIVSRTDQDTTPETISTWGRAYRYENGLCSWYCPPEYSDALFKAISQVALEDVIATAREVQKFNAVHPASLAERVAGRSRLYEASWWLYRAAANELHMQLAEIGLQRAGLNTVRTFSEARSAFDRLLEEK